jgi:fructan beta-fructosidase
MCFIRKTFTPFLATLVLLHPETSKGQSDSQAEAHRPRFHFTPKRNWMNDPNGLVSHKGVYHMFFQYHPDGTRWGPMHWGHAVSRDLLSWEEKPIALYPDSMGYIFSGSAVVDSLNTSGFGMEGKTPIVAIFTHHNPVREAAGQRGFQYQSLAYSLDDGETWKKFPGNPVLQNTAATDFRDPKVHWHEATGRWVMSLATRDRVTFFSSPDLKAWARESAFGEKLGAHGGVWECPDLFPIEHKGRTVWVLLVSINPGAPNGGSGTQYFLGDFDGHRFKPFDDKTRWIDYGTDDYAGVTFSNTGDRRIFIGWMSNWNYGSFLK